MKTVTLHMPEDLYERVKQVAALEGRSAAAVLRDAAERLLADRERGHSVLDIEPHRCGRTLGDWSRDEVWDEMFSDRT